jgi:hypothetical protein
VQQETLGRPAFFKALSNRPKALAASGPIRISGPMLAALPPSQENETGFK